MRSYLTAFLTIIISTNVAVAFSPVRVTFRPNQNDVVASRCTFNYNRNRRIYAEGESDGSGSKSTRRNRRRVRKKVSDMNVMDVGKVVEEKVDDEAAVIPNKADSVKLEIQDIQSIVSGGKNVKPSSPENKSDDSGEEEDDDSLKRILADAKRLRKDSGGKSLTDEEANIGDKLKDIVSTIVTIDFFVICGFLLWFVVGVISSTVLGNDSIQIAFNGVFQPLVQPALGILMIGALGSTLLSSEESN